MLARLKKLLNAESASMFLFDSDREELVLNSVFNEHKAQFKGVRQRLGEGVAGSVAHQRQAVLVKDISTDPRFPKLGSAITRPIRSSACRSSRRTP